MEHLLDYFTPHHYDLHLCLDKTQKLLTGTVHITGTPHHDTIKLHAKSLEINDITINHQPTPFTQANDTLLFKVQP